MIYTVGEMAQKLGVPASTLRYYDKEGLLPFVERSSGGIRMFRENDFEWLQVIRCMKKAGMSIKDIRQYIELSMQGDDTIDTRLEMFRHQREVLTQQIQQLQHTLETVLSLRSMTVTLVFLTFIVFSERKPPPEYSTTYT